jgi:hypothetical protein
VEASGNYRRHFREFLPLPNVKSGITFVGGVIDFRAGRISLAW